MKGWTKISEYNRFLLRCNSETWNCRPDVFKFEPIFILVICRQKHPWIVSLHSDSLLMEFCSLYLGCYQPNSIFSIFNVLLKIAWYCPFSPHGINKLCLIWVINTGSTSFSYQLCWETANIGFYSSLMQHRNYKPRYPFIISVELDWYAALKEIYYNCKTF